MKIQFQYILLLVACAFAEKQIKLEDIERDNLLNEQKINRKESLHEDQSQHLRPPGILASSSYENTGEGNENELTEDIIYAQQGNNANEDYDIQNQQIQYVTPQPYEQEKEYAQQQDSSFPQVHENSGHTYAAPSRQSLISPNVQKPSASPFPYLAQQPRYVYVQAGSQQVSPSGVITYSQPQHAPESIHQQQQQQQQDITYAPVDQNQIHETSQQAAHAPQLSSNYGAPGFVQYVPFLAQTPSHQNYIMVVPFRSIPTHTQAYAIQNVPAQYGHQQHSQQLETSQPAAGYSHSVGPIEEQSALRPPESTASPISNAHYGIQSNSFAYQPPQQQQLHYSPQQIQFQQSLEYTLPPQQTIEYHAPKVTSLASPPYAQNYAQQFTPTIDFFGSFNKQHTSLLDSYIPSSVIIARQRALGRQLAQSAANTHGSHQPGYNTIAYSTPQGYGYAKRSPKIHKLNKKN